MARKEKREVRKPTGVPLARLTEGHHWTKGDEIAAVMGLPPMIRIDA